MYYIFVFIFCVAVRGEDVRHQFKQAREIVNVNNAMKIFQRVDTGKIKCELKGDNCGPVSKIPPNTKHIADVGLRPDNYYQKRLAEIDVMRNGPLKNHPYPHKFNITTATEEFYYKYSHLNNGDLVENETIALAGRVYEIRKLSPNLAFYNLRTEDGVIQVMVASKMYESEETFVLDTNKLKHGDIVGCIGHPGKTSKGDLSLLATKLTLLAPCLHEVTNNVTDKVKHQKRYINLMWNNKSKHIFRTRAKIISHIRKFLDNMGFLEVETPILNKLPGGALAIPFLTHHDFTNMDYYLRIAPELYHKMLVVGGLNRVYEIGRQFRNEKFDATHNPEFTSCEFYMAYADYNDLMAITESLLSELVMSIHGSHKVKYHPNGLLGEEVEIDFTPPYARVSMIPTLEKEMNVTFPSAEKMNTTEANTFLLKLCEKFEVGCSPPRTTAVILDELVGTFIQDKISNPTFIIDYPQIMSPLAKYHRKFPGLTERFELYVMKKEIGNAYTELNDPFDQREQFAQQDKEREDGNKEIPPTDEDFLTALEYGLPPTAGLGLGIDRIVMFLTDSSSIKDVLLFPAANP